MVGIRNLPKYDPQFKLRQIIHSNEIDNERSVNKSQSPHRSDKLATTDGADSEPHQHATCHLASISSDISVNCQVMLEFSIIKKLSCKSNICTKTNSQFMKPI